MDKWKVNGLRIAMMMPSHLDIGSGMEQIRSSMWLGLR